MLFDNLETRHYTKESASKLHIVNSPAAKQYARVSKLESEEVAAKASLEQLKIDIAEAVINHKLSSLKVEQLREGNRYKVESLGTDELVEQVSVAEEELKCVEEKAQLDHLIADMPQAEARCSLLALRLKQAHLDAEAARKIEEARMLACKHAEVLAAQTKHPAPTDRLQSKRRSSTRRLS